LRDRGSIPLDLLFNLKFDIFRSTSGLFRIELNVESSTYDDAFINIPYGLLSSRLLWNFRYLSLIFFCSCRLGEKLLFLFFLLIIWVLGPNFLA